MVPPLSQQVKGWVWLTGWKQRRGAVQLHAAELRCGISAGTGCRTGNYSHASKQGSRSSALRCLLASNSCRPTFTEHVLCHSVEEQTCFCYWVHVYGCKWVDRMAVVPSGWLGVQNYPLLFGLGNLHNLHTLFGDHMFPSSSTAISAYKQLKSSYFSGFIAFFEQDHSTYLSIIWERILYFLQVKSVSPSRHVLNQRDFLSSIMYLPRETWQQLLTFDL